MPTSPAAATLARVVARKAGGEARPGQQVMCRAVEDALARGRHLLVEAPTGTGKSLAYLVPAVLFAAGGAPGPGDTAGGGGGTRRRVVVVTATKALQEQLVGDDLPFLSEAMAEDGVRFSFAMLKGRSNYLCRAKLAVSLTDGIEARLDFGPGGPQAALAGVVELATWADGTGTGDRADAPAPAAADAVWSQVSVDPGECPGAARCSEGGRCFAESARDRAAAADVVVVNSHLYATH
ncbi:MAG TPA: DEAD/DEAH box helicase, partial [Acidimicrobiia bacterium]|nr:DEAD/DEAH box helicase [Acidimicrobiia bacterium]